MLIAIITSAGTTGFWFAENEDDRSSVFVHISQVEGHKYLHLGDRIQYALGTNPKSGRTWATDVSIICAAPYLPEHHTDLNGTPVKRAFDGDR